MRWRAPVLLSIALTWSACGETAPPPTALDAARRDASVVVTDAPLEVLDAPSSEPDASSSACASPCGAGTVCCHAPLPCAGMCVPDCRLGGGCMGAGLVCSADSGVCEPAGTDASVPADASTPRDATTLDAASADGGPPLDAGLDAAPGRDAGRDSGPVTACTGVAPITGDGRSEALFGTSRWSAQFSGNFVSLSGDTAAIGNEGLWGASAGFVRVFTWNGCTDTWSLEAELAGARTTADDTFGAAVAIEGDTLFVGANMRPDGANTGAVHVFTRSGSTWTEGTVIYPTTGAGGRFGRALGLSGSVLAVGAPYGKDPTSVISYTGIVAVYTRGPGGRWTFADLVLGSDAARDDAFGYAVHLDADTMIVGGPGAFNWSVVPGRPGKAWIFPGSGGAWTEAAALAPSDGANGDWFGRSVARVGDVVLVGAPRHDVTTSGGTVLADAGAVYVFTRAGGAWTETARLTASDASADAHFGFTVAAISSERIVVGAAGAGRLYTLTRSGSTWVEDAPVHSACAGDIGWALDVDGALALSGRPTGVFDLADPDDACVP